MQEQRHKDSERKIVQQIATARSKSLPNPIGLQYMKHKCRKTNGRKMKHERRLAALLEKHKDADAEPYQADDRQKNDRRRPARNTCRYA